MGLSWKERVFMALLGVAAASGLTMLVLILVKAINVLLPADTKFGIVFDAGSSHTSLFVYQWPANKEKDTGVVSQALTCQIEGQWTVMWQPLLPGLDSQEAQWERPLGDKRERHF